MWIILHKYTLSSVAQNPYRSITIYTKNVVLAQFSYVKKEYVFLQQPGIWIVFLIYLNVTLGLKCTITHVSHNKIALYGKYVYNVCFAKTSECCNVQVSIM